MRRARRRRKGLPTGQAGAVAPTHLLRLGWISGTYGLGGALRVRPDDPGSDTLQRVARVFLKVGDTMREYRVSSVSRINRGVLNLKLQGLDNISSARALSGARLMAAAEDLPPVGPGEFYYFQALGCEVTTRAGTKLGVIAEVISTGANDVWVVRDGVKEVLVPVIEDVVKSMDLAERRIVIEAVPGLLG